MAEQFYKEVRGILLGGGALQESYTVIDSTGDIAKVDDVNSLFAQFKGRKVKITIQEVPV